MLEQTLAALFVIGLLLTTVWLLRRKGMVTPNPFGKRLGRSNSMRVVERLHLTAQHSLHLVRLGDELILIGVSPASCAAIAPLKPATQQEMESRIAK